MPGKNHLTLYIDSDLVSIAKSSGLNLSQEFEQWIKIRMNKIESESPIIDKQLEIAKHKSEIQKLESMVEQDKQIEMKQKEETMIVDNMIDNIIEIEMEMDMNKGKKLIDLITDAKVSGIQFLFKKKFNKNLTPVEAKQLLENRIIERGI